MFDNKEVCWPYDVLGLDHEDVDERTVKRAYAKVLKTIDQSAEPEQFQNLRGAYQYALDEARYRCEELHAVSMPHDTIQTSEPRLTKPVSSHAPDAHPVTEPSFASEAVDKAQFNDLIAQAERLMDATPDAFKWKIVLADPLLDVFAYAQEMELFVFRGLCERMRTDEDGNQMLPEFVTQRWIGVIDERFGWTADLPMFTQKFGWQGHNILSLLVHYRRYGTNLIPDKNPVQQEAFERRPWAVNAVLLCIIWTILRFAIEAKLS